MTETIDPHEQKERLRALVDQFRLKTHLAGMDARAYWRETLEPRWRELDRRLEDATSELSDDLAEQAARVENKLLEMLEEASRNPVG